MLLKMALVIIALIILLIIMCFISDHIIDKQFKKEQVERDIVENRLTESLKILCVQLGIDLSYHKELDDAAGRILYYSKNGRLFVDEKLNLFDGYTSFLMYRMLGKNDVPVVIWPDEKRP